VLAANISFSIVLVCYMMEYRLKLWCLTRVIANNMIDRNSIVNPTISTKSKISGAWVKLKRATMSMKPPAEPSRAGDTEIDPVPQD
jgi:hypothetical protein